VVFGVVLRDVVLPDVVPTSTAPAKIKTVPSHRWWVIVSCRNHLPIKTGDRQDKAQIRQAEQRHPRQEGDDQGRNPQGNERV